MDTFTALGIPKLKIAFRLDVLAGELLQLPELGTGDVLRVQQGLGAKATILCEARQEKKARCFIFKDNILCYF